MDEIQQQPQQPVGNGAVFTPPSKGMSIASIVLGVLWCNIISLILGIIGNSKINASAVLNDPVAAEASAKSGQLLGKIGLIFALVSFISGIVIWLLYMFVFVAAAASSY